MKRLYRITALALVMLLCLSAFAVNAFAAEPQSTVFSAKVTIGGPKPIPAEKYTVMLEPLDSSNPMPAGSEDGAYKLTITGAGKEDFPAIEFTTVGIYQYKIYQMVGKSANETYDHTVYTATVYVLDSETEEDALTVTVVLNSEGSDGKQDGISFKNVYYNPNQPKTGDETHLLLWMSLMIISGAAGAGVLFFERKKQKKY
ncbi:MAG: hypothetical protein KBS74_01030 [Clostridiales bacterium]|nr:hypothetical protein [Candidatus Cacconaster stercorequi]